MKKILSLVAALIICSAAMSQRNYGIVHQGEFGLTVGAAHYFGDLNTRAAINRPKPAMGLFFRKNFGDYIGARIAARYAQVGYSDTYSKNEYQKLRNLSFNSNIWEIALQGDFNFFKFIPGDPAYGFTPYVTLGIGMFTYDPYAYLYGEKYFLRPLGTEGQAAGYLGRKEYNTMSYSIPFGVGLKYNLNEKFNINFEVAHRFTGTDYLDDVSTTYAGATSFPSGPTGPSVAYLLQDRSYELQPNNPLGVQGRQRGNSKQKDQYSIVEIGISYNISSSRCPTVN